MFLAYMNIRLYWSVDNKKGRRLTPFALYVIYGAVLLCCLHFARLDLASDLLNLVEYA